MDDGSGQWTNGTEKPVLIHASVVDPGPGRRHGRLLAADRRSLSADYDGPMELRQLRYFVAVAEELNFGRAAVRLRIAGPSLSQQIKALERDLGVRLFDRDRRSVTLTAAGQAVLADTPTILDRADNLRRLAARLARSEPGPLRELQSRAGRPRR